MQLSLEFYALALWLNLSSMLAIAVDAVPYVLHALPFPKLAVIAVRLAVVIIQLCCFTCNVILVYMSIMSDFNNNCHVFTISWTHNIHFVWNCRWPGPFLSHVDKKMRQTNNRRTYWVFAQAKNFSSNEFQERITVNYLYGFLFPHKKVVALSVAYNAFGEMGLLLHLHAFKLNNITYLIHTSTYNVIEYVRATKIWTMPQTFKHQRQEMWQTFIHETKHRLCDDVMEVIHEHLFPVCAKCNEDLFVPSCMSCWYHYQHNKWRRRPDKFSFRLSYCGPLFNPLAPIMAWAFRFQATGNVRAFHIKASGAVSAVAWSTV